MPSNILKIFHLPYFCVSIYECGIHEEVMIMNREKDLKPDKAADKVEMSLEDMERVSGGVGFAPPQQEYCNKCRKYITFFTRSEWRDHLSNCQGR